MSFRRFLRHAELFFCYSEPFFCHSERSEESSAAKHLVPSTTPESFPAFRATKMNRAAAFINMTEPWWHRLPACAAASLHLASSSSQHQAIPPIPFSTPRRGEHLGVRGKVSVGCVPRTKTSYERPALFHPALFRNTPQPHPETLAILVASPEPTAETSGTLAASYGTRFRPMRPNRPHRRPNLLISQHNFFISLPAHLTYSNYSINIFGSLPPTPKKRQKCAPNKKGTGFSTVENPCPFSARGRQSPAPPAFHVTSRINYFNTLYTVPIMEETITIITAKNRFTNIIVNISEPG